jgi:uncharacterized protein (TIGR01777 family)
MKVVVTGATGFIGRELAARLLAEGDAVHALARNRGVLSGAVAFSRWDALEGEPPPESLRGADAIIHLAAEPIAQMWTREAKRRIQDSRRIGTENLISGISKLDRLPEVLISASAVGYYGSRGEEELTESSASGDDYLAKVCVEWEAAADSAIALGIRVVKLRTGLVLGAEGGALKRMLPPFRMGVGGPLGSGRHWMSWIHLDDLTRLILFAIENRPAEGPLNAVAPNPVRNSEFTRALGRALHRPAVLPIPGLALKVLYGEMAGILLVSQRVLPRRTLALGFRHQHTDLDEALRAVLR